MPLDIRFILPAELVVLPAALVALAVVAWHARLEDTRTIVWRGLAVAYGASLVATTLFPFRVIVGRGADPVDLDAVQVIPLLRADPAGLVLNAALFVPLGVILCALVRGITGRRAALVGFVVSLGIEVAQLVQSLLVSGSRAFDVDDLIANTAGAVAGWAAYRLVTSSRATQATVGTGFSSRAHGEP